MWLIWPKGTSERKEGIANASDYLETWDDSDSITAVNAQRIWDILQKWWHNHLEAQYQGSETNYEHTEVVETELWLKSNNLISYYGLVTRDPDRRWET